MAGEEQSHKVESLHDVQEIIYEVSDIKKKVNEMYYALIGNPLSKDGGMIEKINEHERRIVELEKRCQQIEKNESKNSLYVRIMWGMAGVAGTSLFGYLISIVFKK